MTLKPYKTLLTRASDEFIINKSRFIGYGAPAASEEEALGFLADVRSAHKDASHHCYAYIIGANMGVMRYSDDGEPGGTAGMPIIEVMKARQVTNACVVVVRYFGGMGVLVFVIVAISAACCWARAGLRARIRRVRRRRSMLRAWARCRRRAGT